MELEGYIACIYEGSAEKAIIEILLENDRLKFTFDDLLEGTLIEDRAAKAFEKRYLRKEFGREITVVRILDSRTEKFSLSKAYQHKVHRVYDIITPPEIEMLVIHSKNQYDAFKKSKKKPSAFCKENLKLPSVKDYEFVRKYFSDVEMLVDAIKEYRRVAKIEKGEYTISDLLK